MTRVPPISTADNGLCDLHSLLPECGRKIDGRMNLEISSISPVIYHLTNVVMTLCFKNHYITRVGAQASEDGDGFETG
jgi:hypothetical protein